MDGLDHIGIAVDREVGVLALLLAQLVGVCDQALHLGLRAAVAELQVVQHRVVLLRKALVGVLHVRHVGTHLVHVVRHVAHRHVGVVGRLGHVSAARRDERGREARGLRHVLVGGHPAGLVRLCGITLQRLRRGAEQGVDAANKLLVVCICGKGRAANRGHGPCERCEPGHRRSGDALGYGSKPCQDARGLLGPAVDADGHGVAEGLACGVALAAELLADFAREAVHRRHQGHIGRPDTSRHLPLLSPGSCLSLPWLPARSRGGAQALRAAPAS